MTKLQAELPGPVVPRSRRPKWQLVSAITLFATWSTWLYLFAPSPGLPLSERRTRQHSADNEMCVQTGPLIPQKNGSLWNNLTALHATDDFLARAISQLSAAVQIPTETFDAMGPIGEDARWQSRGSFVDHLEKSFPLLYVRLATAVNGAEGEETEQTLHVSPGKGEHLWTLVHLAGIKFHSQTHSAHGTLR